jgi:hypothetical protein
MKKTNHRRPTNLTLPVLGGIAAGINGSSNAALIDAMDAPSETAYLLAHPANAAHLRKSIRQYKKT